MQEYLSLVEHVLTRGSHRPNRTGVDTISTFNYNYEVNVSEEAGYPLLTTKKMDTFRWDSMLHELLWYRDGEHHIRRLQEETSIWDAWADDDANLPTAYGRFWRRFPVPDSHHQLSGEAWATDSPWTREECKYKFTIDDYVDEEIAMKRFFEEVSRDDFIVFDEVTKYYDSGETVITFYADRESAHTLRESCTADVRKVRERGKTLDQLQYVIDTLNGDNPDKSADSRRLVVNAWHPANAAVSGLPPCHYSFVFNVTGEKLNLHLTQRSADVALGVPFNIACYAALLRIIAQQTGFNPGTFAHSLVDAHIYCGTGERGNWYEDPSGLETALELEFSTAENPSFAAAADWIEQNAPPDPDNLDHVPNLLRQLDRNPYSRPTLEVADKPIDKLTPDDITLKNYSSYDGLSFGVAE